MEEKELVKEAGLTEGESRVYLSLLKIGSSTTGPLIEKSKIARSFIYNILDKLIEKGLVSYIVKDNIKYYQASEPNKILDYIEEKKRKLELSKIKVENLLPKLLMLKESSPKTEIQIYEGFKGLKTVFEHHFLKLKKNDEAVSLGVPSLQEEKYHEYWKRYHMKRAKIGIKNKMLFNKNTNPKILKNRNSYKGCEARYMESNIETPAWIFMYLDVTIIFLQDPPIAVEIINDKIAKTFKAYFEDYWKKSKPFKN